jgi:hypothetical protein
MAIVLNDVVSNNNTSVMNANFAKIEDAINNDLLKREIEDGEANEMRTHLDMNANKQVNLLDGVDPNDAATVGQMEAFQDTISDGEDGSDGATGATGAPGAKGDTGDTGAPGADGEDGVDGTGTVVSVVAGTNVTVDDTDPANPIVSSTGGTSSPLTTKGDVYTYDTAEQRLAVGTDGQVLTVDSSEPTGLKFATPSAGGSDIFYVGDPHFAPPKASDFPVSVNMAGQIFTDTEVGLVLENTSSSADHRAQVKAMPSGVWAAKARLLLSFSYENDDSTGLIIRDSSAEGFITLRFVAEGTHFRVGVTKWNNAGGFAGHYLTSVQVISRGNYFVEIEDDGVNFTFRIGADGESFRDLVSVPRLDHLSSPDQIGLFVHSSATIINTCTYWDDPDTPAAPVGTLTTLSEQTPASASAAGTKDTIVHDTDYIYVCTATNTWKRVAITTWA